mgnify:CR=1 FL=1
MNRGVLARLQAARAEGRPVVLATALPGGAQLLLPDDQAPTAIQDAAAAVLQSDRSATVQADGAAWFLHAYNPPLRLVVVGAVHIAQALVPMAAKLRASSTSVEKRVSGNCFTSVMRRCTAGPTGW